MLLIFILLVLLFFICCFSFIFFSTSCLTFPWPIARVIDPFRTFNPVHHSVILDTFIFQPFCYLLTASATVLSGHFLPTGVLYSFPTFWHNLLLSRFCWEPAVTFLKVAGLHTDPRNTDPAHLFVWFTVIHNLLYILSLYL